VLARALDVDGAHLPGIWSFTEGTMLVVLAVELVSTVSLHRCAGWRAWARRHVSYGARGVTATLAYEINTKLDVWMLGAFGIAKAQVGIYSVAAALNEGATQLSVVMQNNLNPMIARSLAAGPTPTGSGAAKAEAAVKRTQRWFGPGFAGACALGAAVFPILIPWLIGGEYRAGSWPFVILMTGLALSSPFLPFTQVLLMANRPGWHTAFVVMVVSINFVA